VSQKSNESFKWHVDDSRPSASLRRCVRCSITREQAASLVLATAKIRRLLVAGFRLGRAPARLVYAYHQKICDDELVEHLRNDLREVLQGKLSKAFTPPEFKTITWDGESDLTIEVSFFEAPTAPATDAISKANASAATEPVAIPFPGINLKVTDYLPAVMHAHGVLSGLQFQIGLTQGKQSSQPSGASALGVSGTFAYDSSLTAHLPAVGHATPMLNPRPAPAVPNIDKPGPAALSPIPGSACSNALQLAAPDTAQVQAALPALTPRTSQPSVP
jgi:hypothetical protein